MWPRSWEGRERPVEELWTRTAPKGGPWSHKEGRVAQVTSLALADALIESGGADRVVLVPCAVGGTSIVEWLPDPEDAAKAGTLFGNCLQAARFAKGLRDVAGFFFHQGESDARDWIRGPYWEPMARTVLIAFREELQAPGLPIVLGRLGDLSRETKKERRWLDDVVDGQARLTLPCVSKVETTDLPMKSDYVHYSLEGQLELGRRYEKAWSALEPRCGDVS
ncbi:MAG: sialate O-acetylesterase [Pseudomonadota bacterium]